MRVIITIPHYWRPGDSPLYASRRAKKAERLAAIQGCLASICQHLAEPSLWANLSSPRHTVANHTTAVTLDLVACVHENNHLLDDLPIDDKLLARVVSTGNPMHLGFACHGVLRERLGQYDIYGYLEDDLVIHDAWWFSKLVWFWKLAGGDAVLQPNRYELSRSDLRKKVYIDGTLPVDRTARYQDVSEQPTLYRTYLGCTVAFERTLNPHAGCFFLSAEQMARWTKAPYFLDHDGSFFSPLEGAATVGVMRTFRVCKPAPQNASFLELEHAGDAWINKIAARDKMVTGNGKGISAVQATHSNGGHIAPAAVGWAIDFCGDAFDITGERLLGRQMAGKEFLQALMAHSRAETLHCLAASPDKFRSFANWTNAVAKGQKHAQWIRPDRLNELAVPGTLYHPSVDIASLAWRRRAVGQRLYSLVGVTHATCTKRVIDTLSRFATSPLQTWDALVCTSAAVKTSLEHIFSEWHDYLAQRFGTAPAIRCRLPVIPLGVDCHKFSRLRSDPAARAKVR